MNLFHESKKILDKDGKVNPLGPYGRQKLTGREVSTYFRRNPVRDAQIKKAVEVALDLQGAMTVASKEIKKFYGDKILRSKEVQKALKYANESVEHDIREDLQEVALGPNMLRKDFPNVWATKDAKLYRVLAKSISQDGFIDNLKAYKKDKKKFVDDLKKIAKNPKKYEKSYGRNFSQYINNPKPNQNFAKLPESINEVTDKEINMAKKLSKDMEKVKKGYQQIAKTGDKTLMDTKFNDTYKSILDAQQKVLSLIGQLNNSKMIGTSGVKLAPYKVKGRVGKPQRINNSFDMMDTYRNMHDAEHCELVEGKVLKFTKVKDKSLEKHLKVVTKKVGAKLEKIAGGFAVSDTDMRGFTAVVDYIFDKSIKKNMLDGGGMSDVNMVSENSVMSVDKKNMPKAKPMIQKLARARGVPVSFDKDGIGVTFKGRDKDVEKLMRDFEKNKTLMKLMEKSPKLDVMDEYAKMYEDAVQKAREKQRLSDTHKREKEALAKKHARMKEQKELDEGMIDLDKARKLPDNIQKQILDLKKEYDRTWDGVFVPMGDEGTSQRKEYERRGKLFKAASKKYKDFLKKHKVATFK